jgi:hypothetical protein
MWSSDLYTSQEPVLSDWSKPAMGAPPRADWLGKPLFGNEDHLVTVGQHRKKEKIIPESNF